MCSYSHISMIPFMFMSIVVPFLMILCINTKKRSKPSSQEEVRSTATAPVSTTVSLTSEENDKSEKSTKSERGCRKATDSLRVPRKNNHQLSNSQKSVKSGKSTKSTKSLKTEDDSARTEIIVVPIGKAALKDSESHDIMTPADEQKGANDSGETRKVSFAESLRKLRHRGKKPASCEDELTNYIP